MASATLEVGPAPTDAPATQSAGNAEIPRLCRPSAAELVAAGKALKDMAVAKIIGSKATRTARATIACAIALHAGESFASDNAAKRAFGGGAALLRGEVLLPRGEGARCTCHSVNPPTGT